MTEQNAVTAIYGNPERAETHTLSRRTQVNVISALSFRIRAATHRPARILLAAAFTAASLSGFSGCAAIRNQEAIKTERVLAAAGFQMKLADSPEKLAHLATLPQRNLAPRQKDGETWYVYADASACKCLYAGPEEAYQRYQKLALQQRISRQNEQAAEMNEDASMNWRVWGGGWRRW
jgi:hypothetical protein